MHEQPGHNKPPYAQLLPSFLGMGVWMTLLLKVALIHKLRGSSMCLAYSFDMLSMAVYAIRHWQTTGRLVQELKACTLAGAVAQHYILCSILLQLSKSMSEYRIQPKVKEGTYLTDKHISDPRSL